MRIKTFGRTGLTVSEYGLGTLAMGGGIHGRVDDGDSIRTIHRAEDLGINFIDTAPMFGIGQLQDGRAESVIGEALEGRRDHWIIASKYGRHLNGKHPWWEMYEDFSGAQAILNVENSLRRLRTDYLDVFYVHSPPRDKFDPEDAFTAMTRLKQQGKIRVVGFSFGDDVADTLDKVESYLRNGTIEAVQVKLNLLWPDRVVSDLLPLARAHNVAVVVRQTLASGFLTGSFTATTLFDPEDHKSTIPIEELRKRLNRADQFRFLADRQGDVPTLLSAAIHWTLSHSGITAAIPGAKTAEELDQCLLAADAPYFTPEQMQKASAIQKGWN